MSEFSIQTAQNIQIKQNLASIGSRFFAFLIDSFIIFWFYIFVFYLLSKMNLKDIHSNIEIYAFLMVLTLPLFLYFPVIQYWNNGQTPGKMAMKIRVVKIDNTHPRLLDFVIRWLFRIVEVNLIPGIGLIAILFSEKKQRLGDMVAKTTVVSEKKRVDINQSIFKSVDKNYQPVFPEVKYLSEQQIQLIKNIYDQANKTYNRQLFKQLSDTIEHTYGIEKPKEMNERRFINTIFKDHNYYSNIQ